MLKKCFSKSNFSEMRYLLILLPLLVVGVYSDDNCKSVRADFQACTQQWDIIFAFRCLQITIFNIILAIKPSFVNSSGHNFSSFSIIPYRHHLEQDSFKSNLKSYFLRAYATYSAAYRGGGDGRDSFRFGLFLKKTIYLIFPSNTCYYIIIYFRQYYKMEI